MKAILQALIYVVDYIKEVTPKDWDQTYGHPADQILRNLQREMSNHE